MTRKGIIYFELCDVVSLGILTSFVVWLLDNQISKRVISAEGDKTNQVVMLADRLK